MGQDQNLGFAVNHGDDFTLEALEPRLLLSADPSLLSEILTETDPSASAGVMEAELHEDFPASPHDLTSDSESFDLLDVDNAELIPADGSEPETLVLQTGDVLAGVGEVAGRVVNSGAVKPGNSPGIMMLTDFTQNADGMTVIEIGGTDGPGVDPSGHDQIQVTNDVSLDGLLEIQLINGFTPSMGDSFEILTWGGSRTGEFSLWKGSAIAANNGIAFKPVYNDATKKLTLEVVSVHSVTPTAETALQTGLAHLEQIGDALDGIDQFADNLPLVGNSLGALVDTGTAINDALQSPLATLLAGLPTQAQVTATIEGWDGMTLGLFDVTVNGVLGNYGAMAADPMSWDVSLTISRTQSVTLNLGSGALFDAVFGSAPMVNFTAEVNLDFRFGYDGVFYVELDKLEGKLGADTTLAGGSDLDLTESGGTSNIAISGGSLMLEASVMAAADASILTSGRIEGATLADIAGGSISVGDAFNLTPGGAADVSFDLASTPAFPALDYSGSRALTLNLTELFGEPDPDFRLAVSGSLMIGGQSLSGTFSFRKAPSGILVQASGVSLELSTGAGATKKRVALFENGSGTFLYNDDGVAGTASLTLTDGPDHANLSLTGASASLAFNTTDDAISDIDGVTVNLPAGDFLRVSGSLELSLTDPQASLTGSFVFERHDPTPGSPDSGDEVVTTALSGGSFAFDDGTSDLLSVSGVSGALVFTPDGVVGEAEGSVSLNAGGLALSGTFQVALNDTSSAYMQTVPVEGASVMIDVPAGPYLRVSGDDAILTVLGIGLTGDFVFEERTTDIGAERVVTVAASDVALNLGSLADPDMLQLTNGSGAFLINSDGLAGSASVDAALNLSGVSLSGTFNLALNETEAAVSDTVEVMGSSEMIDVPAGPFLQVQGMGATLEMFGISMSGDYTFQQITTESASQWIAVDAQNVAFNFASSVLTAANGSAVFLMTDSGLAGEGMITIGVGAFGVGFSQTVAWNFNSTSSAIDESFSVNGTDYEYQYDAGPYHRLITSTSVSLTLGVASQMQSLTATLAITLVENESGSDYATIGVSGLSATLGTGSVSLALSDGSGAFYLDQNGVAGSVGIGTVVLSGPSGVTVTSQGLRLKFNNTGADVGPISVAVSEDSSEDVTLEFTGAYFHDYLAVSGAAQIDLSGYAVLGGVFTFEISAADPNSFTVAAEDVMFNLQAGSVNVVSFHQGSGVFVVTSSGFFGEATLDFDVGLIALSGTVALEVNTTNAAQSATVTTSGGMTSLSLTDTEYLRLCVNGHLLLGSVAVPLNFTIQANTGTGTVEFRDKNTNNLLVSVDSSGAVTLGGGLSADDFALAGPLEFVSMLRQLANWLALFRDSELFDIEIPFTDGATLGSAFDWSQAFLDEVFSHVVSIEFLASRDLDQDLTDNGGNTILSGSDFDLKIGDTTYSGFSVSGSFSSVENPVDPYDATTLAGLFNNEFAAKGVDSKVVARVNNSAGTGTFVIALKPAQIAENPTLELHNPNSEMSGTLGFSPDDGDADAPEQVGLENQRFTVEELIEELGMLLTGSPVTYNPAAQMYSFPASIAWSPSSPLTVPFGFDADLGPLANANLSGELELTASLGLDFTLGFDLAAASAPMVLSSTLVPVPSHGRLSDDAHFEVFFNDDPSGVSLTLSAAATAGNNSIVDLAADLNALFATQTYGGDDLDDILYAQKAGNGLAIMVLAEDADEDGALDAGEDTNGNGALDSHLNLIRKLTVRAQSGDPFATELGFGAEVTDLDGNSATTNDQYYLTSSTSPMKGLFVEDVSLSGSVSLNTTTPISGSLNFGFVEISTSGGSVGTVEFDGVTSNPITVGVELQDDDTGADRFYVNELYTNLDVDSILSMVQGPDFGGSFLARLDNIAVNDGLLNLGSDPEISLWIPDINHLEYNPDPYDGTNTGLFLTYPDLSNLLNFDEFNFSSLIKALKSVADSLSELSAFSFLDDKLPLIDISVNDILDYAQKFADLVDELSASSQSSLQGALSKLEDSIESLFDLDPSILSLVLDDNGLGTEILTAGGTGAAMASATVDPDGDNNGIVVTRTVNGAEWNDVSVRVKGDASLSGDQAEAVWDETNKVLTLLISGGDTTANTLVTAVNDLSDWSAALKPVDNGDGGNTGAGVVTGKSLKFSLTFSVGYANSFPLQLDLKELVASLTGENEAVAAFLDAATTLIQVEGSGQLTVSASAELTLDFGIDLTRPLAPRPFFYDTTGVELRAKALGSDLEIEASLGSIVGIFIRDGAVTLDADGNPETDAGDGDQGAEFRLGLRDNNGDGRHYFNEDWFNSDSIDLHLLGGVSAMLPIFAPTEGLALGGDSDENGDGYPDNQLVIDIPDLMRLFTDTRADSGVATVRIPGGLNDLEIQDLSGNNDDFTVALEEDNSQGPGANADFTNGVLTVSLDSGSTTAQGVKTAIEALGGFSVSFLDDDPSGVNDGSGVVTVSKAAVATPDFSSLFQDLDFCDLIDSHAGLLLDGIDSFLGSIQSGLEAIVLNQNLPLVGSGLANAVSFIDSFRNGLLLELRNRVEAAGGSATTAIEDAIKEAFWNTLGPGGLDILVNPEDASELDESEGFSQLDVSLDCDDGLVVNLRLRSELALLDTTSNPIDLDLGVPGFGLEVSGNVQVSIGFDLMFGFGLNKEDGFYFDSSADEELSLFFMASIPGLAAAGQIAFLQLDVSDDPDDPSMFEGQFYIDLMDPNDDGKLTFAEITSSGSQFSDIIDAGLEAVADVNLDLSASFGGNTAFPRVVGEFHLDWMWDLENGASKPQIMFSNLALDLGTFISDFLSPILTEIQKVTEPLQPIIDIATARLPVLSDLAGKTVTFLDLAEAFGYLEPSTRKFIDNVLQIIELINNIPTGSGSIMIPFGAFSLGDDGSGNMNQINPLGNLSEIDVDQVISDAADTDASATYKNQVSGFMGDVNSLDNFKIPIFENPSVLFNLFVGEPVPLVEWHMPAFIFEFSYVQKIAIYPPLYAQFGGSIGAKIEVGFGYDTFGIQKFIGSEDRNPLDLLDGFYVIDFDEHGNDRNELELTGELFAGASIDLLIAEVGVRGGLYATIGFDLNDVNDDGKVRISEIIANAQQDPRCIFNIHGELGLFLEAFLTVDLFFFSIDKTWRFGEFTLFEFSITCPEPVLASDDGGGNLTLHVGSRAADRQEIDTNDNAETIVVKHVGGSAGAESVEVSWGNYSQTFDNVKKIIVEDAGAGDDVIDLRGVLAEADIRGGVGNDTLYLSHGANSKAYGDEGNDLLVASSEASATGVTLYGGDGNDNFTPGTAAIIIYGGNGNDILVGTSEDDELYGEGGADSLDGLAGNDKLRGGDGNDDIRGGPGADDADGGAGNDVIEGGRDSDLLIGGPGEDQLLGGSGNDFLVGGDNDDQLYGHSGIDLLIGDDYGSFNGGAPDPSTLQADLAAAVANGFLLEDITGGAYDPSLTGDDALVGGGSSDFLFGGPGNDFLYGGNLFANGQTEVIEEDHNDFIDGGPGDDEIFGDDALGRTGDRDTGIGVSGAVFLDLVENGLRDEEELGFGGVLVSLYRNDGVFIADETTATDGSFEFTGLDPDRYYLTFSKPAGLDYATPLAGGAATPEDASNDSDAEDGTGVLPAGQTQDFELTFDETETAVTAGFKGDAQVSISDISLDEGDTGQTLATFTITLAAPRIQIITIDYETADGSATAADGDYVHVEGTLEFEPGVTSKQISVAVLGDDKYEEHEQFVLALSNASSGVVLPASPSVLATIVNDDAVPQISIGDFVPVPVDHDADENTAPIYVETTPNVFVVSLTNPSYHAVTVEYTTDAALTFSGLEAENAAIPSGLFPQFDFTQTFGTLTFLPGETRKEITVMAEHDTLDEHDEHYYVTLTNPVYATLDDDRGYGVIADDDDPVSATIEASIPYMGDPFMTEVTEEDALSVVVDFEVRLSAKSGKTVTVNYSSAPGTAVGAVFSGSGETPDYIPVPHGGLAEELRELKFAPGELVKTISVEVLPDNAVEGDEYFFMNLLTADAAEIAANPLAESNHVVVRIADDDTAADPNTGPWNIRFSDKLYTIEEPDSGSANAEITVIRNPGSTHAIAVLTTYDLTATAGADYTPLFRELIVFGDGEYSKKVEIPVHADALVEGPERVRLELRSPTGSPVNGLPYLADLEIIDEDTPLVTVEPPEFFSIPWLGTIYGIKEGSGGGVDSHDFVIKLVDENGAASVAGPAGVSIAYRTVALTAKEPADFTQKTGVAFIPSGSSEVMVAVDVVKDDLAEATENFALRLTSATGALLLDENSVAIANVFDDDPKEITGNVFYDRNENGFRDFDESGIEDVDVTLTWFEDGAEQSATVQTDSNGDYQHDVFLGQVTISVDGTTVLSPYQKGAGLLAALPWSGEYETTTFNEVQTVEFEGVVGISPFEDVGYDSSHSFSQPSESDDVGRGGTDDTLFGGPGDDEIDAGAGDDHIIGGHWMTATDENMPVNDAAYDAEVTVVDDTTDLSFLGPGVELHSIYDEGPIFSVNPTSFAGAISGEIWEDLDSDNQQDGGELFSGQEVLVHLLDSTGNPVNSLVTTTGVYSFTNLYVDPDNPAAESKYIVEFEIPDDYEFAEANLGGETVDSDAEFAARTAKLAISHNNPTQTDVDAGVVSRDLSPDAQGQRLVFSRNSYTLSETDPAGKVLVTLTRSDTTAESAWVLHAEDATAVDGVNYLFPDELVVFGVGVASVTVEIQILDSGALGICDMVHFTLSAREPTGRPGDDTTVYIVGEGAASISDDDTILGGDDWDIALGDSGNIPGYAVVHEYANINQSQYLGDIERFGGPGDDTIDMGLGADYVDGQLGDDDLRGGDGVDIVIGGLGDDVLTVGQGDDDLEGNHGLDTVVSQREVLGIELDPGKLTHIDSDLTILNEHILHDTFELARLFGDYQDNVFDIADWLASAYIYGNLGDDTLMAGADTDMTLLDVTLPYPQDGYFEQDHGFSKDAAVSLANGETYHLGSLETVSLTGGAGDNTLDASGYSKPVTLEGLAGSDTLIGGSADDVFLFDVDNVLGFDLITGNGGSDTLDFSASSDPVTVDLSILNPSIQTVLLGRLALQLNDKLENATGGEGNDSLTGNDLDNTLRGGPGDDTLAGGLGDETYAFDTDQLWGSETIIENPGEGNDTLDFSATTTMAVTVNLGVTSAQMINGNLTLTVQDGGGNEGEIESLIGGAGNDTLRGNSFNNVIRGLAGDDLLDGKSGDDFLDGGSGNDHLDGGDDMDSISETEDTDFTLSDSSLARASGETDTLDDIESASLTGGPSANRFDLTGWTGSGSIDGADVAPRIDTVAVAADAHITLDDVQLTVSTSSGSINLTSIEAAELSGGPSANTIDASGFTGDARILGWEGNDILTGGSGRDIIIGGPGDDTLTGNQDNDILDGGSGTDSLTESRTASATEFLLGDGVLLVNEAALPVAELDLHSGIETVSVSGGAFDDVFDFTGWTGGPIMADGQGGTDTIKAAGSGNLVLTATGLTVPSGGGISFLSIEAAELSGGDSNDTLNASAFTGQAELFGGQGNDILIGGRGNDLLDGGDGDDRLVINQDGSADTDTVIGGAGMDTLDFSAFAVGLMVDLGTVAVAQTVVAAESDIVAPSEDIEAVIGGSGNDTITGNSLDNRLTGGLGDDALTGADGFNTVVESADADFTLTAASLTIGGDVDTLATIQAAELTGGASGNMMDASAWTGSVQLVGGAGMDVLIGGAGNDILIGGEGNDDLSGGGGADLYRFDADTQLGEDTLKDTAGVDTLGFGETDTLGIQVDLSLLSSQQTVNSNLKLTILAGTTVEHVIGTAQADMITGNAADNSINPGAGDDVIIGGGGLDTVIAVRDADFTLTDTKLLIGSEKDDLAGISRAVLFGGEGANRMDASAFTAGTVMLIGLGGNDTLFGGSENDQLVGGLGNDTLRAGDGDDFLFGGDGRDFLEGGLGNDFLAGGAGNDSYFFDQSQMLGSDVLEEFAANGYADTLIGVGISGIHVNLWSTLPQLISANLTLRLAFAGTVEASV